MNLCKKNKKACFIRDEEGASAVEYAIMAVMIAAVIVIAVTSIGIKTLGLYNKISALWP